MIKQLERYIIKDITTDKYYLQPHIWRDRAFEITDNITNATQFISKEEAEEVSCCDDKNLKIIKIRISYEEVEDK